MDFKDLIPNPDYYNRHNDLPNVEHIATIAGRDMQSAEQNELQCVIDDKISALGYALYRDGAIIEGCDITLDTDLKVAHMSGGRVFIDGHVRRVDAAVLSIPSDEDVHVGIWKKSRVLTENEDSQLLNPAIGTPSYRQPGAYRVITTAEWGINLDNLHHPFYPIYTISGGEIISQIIREKNQDYLDALARYDRDSHGYYVVEGLRVTALPNAKEEDNGRKQTYSISQGMAHIHGYEARLNHSVRLVVSEDADLYDVISEAHQYDPDEGKAQINVHQTPIESISRVRVTKEKTVNLVHGSYTGCSDPLPDTSVIKIVSVVQGGTTFAASTYRLDANKVKWEVAGDEPAPGSTYTVIYHYRTDIQPDSSDFTSLTLSGLVEGSLIELDYAYRMPRKDIIVMYRDRSVTLVKGIPHRYAPVLPVTPPDAICLATVEQTWTGLPIVKNIAIQAVKMNELTDMRTAIKDLYSLSAMERLKTDAILSAPSQAFGVFVDPLYDDDMRDKGTPQTALIAGRELCLPMDVDILGVESGKILSLDYTAETLIDQPQQTKCMKINPYMAFDPLPAVVTLNPAVDRWTDTFITSISSNTSLTVSTTEDDAAGELRQINVAISARGFGPLEPVRVNFDGVEVPCGTSAANENGIFEGTIKIPKGVPTGVKLVRLQGTHTAGQALFVGTRVIVRQTVYFVPTPPRSVDPLAQTFTLDTTRHVAGVDFWLCKKGISPIRVEIRETAIGFPTDGIITSCQIAPQDLNEGAINRAIFDYPAALQAGTQYAIVILTDTADHEVGICELGDWDPATGWVRSQPYSVGVLLSSANASTWTPHQAADLTFKLLGARFAPGVKTVELGEFDLTGVTDTSILAELAITSSATEVTFILSQNGAEVVRLQGGQIISFPVPLDGVYSLSCELYGDALFSPLLGVDPQLLIGRIGTAGDYISRAFKCGTGKKIMVQIDAIQPGTSGVDVYVLTAEGVWTQAVLDEAEPLGDHWYRNFYFVPCNLSETKLKIALTGDAKDRPRVRDIRGVVLHA